MSRLITGRRKSAAPKRPARLQLTSLVDMMVILVVFLLKSFSVEGQLTQAAEIELPVSSIDDPVVAGLVVEIGPQRLRIGSRDLMATAAVQDDITPLDAALADLTGSGPVSMTVQCDRRLDFQVLGRVLRACGRAGVSDLSLVVLGGES